MVAINDGPNGIAEVAQQVPTVGHLDRLLRALPNSIGVGTSTVARDNFNSGMLTEPIRQRLGLAVRQQIYDLIALKIDENRAVAMSTPPSPIIHPKNF